MAVQYSDQNVGSEVLALQVTGFSFAFGCPHLALFYVILIFLELLA
jgi:hypothetical protein